jgi:hypothetical protein
MRAFFALLPAVVLLAAPLATPACVIPSISATDAGASPAATSSAEDASSSAPSAVQGASCTQLSPTVLLCLYISSCPSLVLNPQVFPQCGFRIYGNAIDPECLCGNYLCPIGSASTCSEAATEASGDTNYDSVCEQSVTGHCLDLNASGSSSSGSSSGSTTNPACQTCVQNCDNVPACIDACGC